MTFTFRSLLAPMAVAVAVAIPATTPALAQGASDAQISRFIEVVAANGCQVTSDTQAAAVESGTGFDNATLSAVLGTLLGDGRAQLLETGGFALRTGPCS